MLAALFTTLLAVGALVGIDQGIKAWAVANLLPVGSLPLWPGVVELRFVYNDGMAFSMLAGKQGVLIGVTSVALLCVFLYLVCKRPADKLEFIALLLIFGGGVGNLVDRVASGRVVDYINLLFMNFAVFNFADICVCTGVGLLVLDYILDEVKRKKQDGAV